MQRDDCFAKIWLDPVRLYSSVGFARSELHTVETLIQEHVDQLRKAWDDYFTS